MTAGPRGPTAGPSDAAFQRLWTKYAALPNYDKAEWTAAFNEIWESPGAPAAARRAPTEAVESLASWVAEEVVEGSDERDGGTAVFWYCAYCDGANGATRDSVGHAPSCPVGAAVTVLGALRAALAAPSDLGGVRPA